MSKIENRKGKDVRQYHGNIEVEIFNALKQEGINDDRPLANVINRILRDYCKERYNIDVRKAELEKLAEEQ